jgi:uncharacterized membrane protein
MPQRFDRPGMSQGDPGEPAGSGDPTSGDTGVDHVGSAGGPRSPEYSTPRRRATSHLASRQAAVPHERVQVALLAAVVTIFAVLTPWPLPDKLRAIGHACCAQIPSHTIRFAGQAMPIDARNSGIYTAVFVTIAMLWLAGRRKAALFVNARIGLVLMAFVLAMVFDGFNSLAATHQLHTFYDDTNNLRVGTGTLAGMALTILVLPLFNLLVWRDPEPVAIAEDFVELSGFLVAALVIIMTLTRAPAVLYYPMSILSIAGLLTTLTFVNTCIGIVSLRLRNQIDSLGAFVLPSLAGLVVACVEIMAVDFWVAGH